MTHEQQEIARVLQEALHAFDLEHHELERVILAAEYTRIRFYNNRFSP